MTKILLVQGANLTFLGRREPHIYGTTTPAEIQRHAQKHGYHLDIFDARQGRGDQPHLSGGGRRRRRACHDSGRIYLRRLRTEGLYQGLSVICVQKVPLRNVWEINALCHASRDWCKTGGVSAS